MSTTNLSVRVDAELKKDVEECLAEMGLTISSAITIYLKQIVLRQEIPFRISSVSVPNRTTLNAIKEGEKIANDPSVPGYTDVEEALRELQK